MATTMQHTDVKLVKTERFCVDAYKALVQLERIGDESRRKLKNYYKGRHNGNYRRVVYDFGAKCKGLGLGRLYAEKGQGLQMLPRNIRAALAAPYYLDVDMVNAQPTVAKTLCLNHGWECAAIAELVENREACLARIADACGLDRTETKEAVIRIFFGGAVPRVLRGKECCYLEQLVREVSNMAANATGVYPESYKVSVKKRHPNPSASNLAYVLQTEEHRCLMAGMDELTAHGRSVDTLIFDGMLVLKEPGEETLPREMLDRVEAAILQVTGHRMQLQVKPLVSDLELGPETPARRAERLEDLYKDCYPYENVKEVFEEEHFKVLMPLSFVRLDGDGGYISWSVHDLKTFYHNLFCVKDGEKSKFVDIWLADPAMRTMKRVENIPPPCAVPEGVFNLWNGFLIDRTDVESSGDVQPFVFHLSLLCSHHAEQLEYLLDLLAQLVQEPGKKIGVIVVIYGGEGCGKTLFWQQFAENVLGADQFLHTVNPKLDLFDKHSSGRVNKTLVVIDEGNARDSYANRDNLWSSITDPTARLERKGIDPVVVRTHERYIICSNNPIAIQADGRRPILLEASIEKQGDSKYFKDLVAYFADPANCKAVVEFLRTRDFSARDWNIRPQGELMKDAMAATADPVLKLLDTLLHELHIEGLQNSRAHVIETQELVRKHKVLLKDVLHVERMPSNRSIETTLGSKLRSEHAARVPEALCKLANYGARKLTAWQFNVPKLQQYMEGKGFSYGGIEDTPFL